MSHDELIFLPAHVLADQIRRRQASCVEVVQAHLAHVARHDARLNAVATLDEAGALAQARERDEALARGDDPGPLTGVPITVKDALEVAHVRTTFGCRWTRNHVPTADAPPVARLRAAGAIILGKSNVPEVSFDWQTVSPIFGRTNNPWDVEKTPGGSSGGAAACVSAGFSALDVGSDGAGSVRVPAHFCGLFALMPTVHRVPSLGHMKLPRTPHGSRNLLSFGLLARSLEDLRLGLSLVAGPDGCDFDVPPVPLDTPSNKPLAARRFAFADAWPGLPVASEVRAVLAQTVRGLEAAGCRVEKVTPPGFNPDEVLFIWGQIAGAEFGTQTPPHLRPALRLIFSILFGPSAWTTGFTCGLGMNLMRYAQALSRRDEIAAGWERFLAENDFDAFLCPPAAVPAFAHRTKGAPVLVDGVKTAYSLAAGAWATLFNLTEGPAAVLPAGLTADGLPIGVQVVGRRWRDAELVSVAGQIAHAVTGEFRRPPGF